jgi:hypothetical protein
MIEHIVFTGSIVILLAALLGFQLGVVAWLLITKPKKEKVVEVVEPVVLDKEAQQWAAYHRFSEKK